MTHRRLACVAIAATAALAACGGGSSDTTTPTGSGTLSVSLTDNPCDHRAVYVTIDRLRAHRSADASDADAGWTDIPLAIPAAQRRVDLLNLQNGVFLKLGDVSLEAGRYTQLRLVLAENGSGGARTDANAVTLADGTTEPLVTPSAQRSGIKLIHPFEVAAGQVVELMLDFDACRSIVRAGNSGRYLLKPTIAVMPLLDVGRITGYAAAVPGTRVSAQTATAIGSPVVVKSTTVDADGRFTLSPLPSGTSGAKYTVVVSTPGKAGAVIKEVPVTRQATTTVSTEAARVPAGDSLQSTVSGSLLPAGVDGALARALQTIGGLIVEVASVNPDAETGAWSFVLPRARAKVATWPTTTPVSLPLSFADATDPPGPGRYTVEGSATGRAAVTSAVLDASAGNVTDVALTLP